MKAIQAGKMILKEESRRINRKANHFFLDLSLESKFGEKYSKEMQEAERKFSIAFQRDNQSDKDSVERYALFKDLSTQEIIEKLYNSLKKYIDIYLKSIDFDKNNTETEDIKKVIDGKEYTQKRKKPNPFKNQLAYEDLSEVYDFPYYSIYDIVEHLTIFNITEIELIDI